jgi:DnaJ family protein B protein 13
MTASSTEMDYYSILELPKNCSQEDIAEAYRFLSLKYHPKVTTQENSAQSEYHFQKLCESYEVLSDPIKKGIYDIYGTEGLKNGIIDKHGNIKGGYKYMGNGHEIFEKFMGTTNPFALKTEEEKGRMSEETSAAFEKSFGEKKKEEKNKLPPIDIDLECTLEELYNGCIKTVTYKKKAISYDLRTTENKEVSIDVEIFKGYDKDTVLTYKEMGNEAPGVRNSDLIIHIREKNHKCFKRVNKNDLIYTHKISLIQALNSDPVILKTLDNRIVPISVDEIISPSTIKVVYGEGMPIFEKELSVRDLNIKKGDLYIKFDIKFPEYIDPLKKMEITSLLENEN